MIAEERETTATLIDADEVVRIYTCRRRDITALSKKAQPVESGTYLDGTRWARFEIPADRFKLATAIRAKRDLSEAQRQALRERAKDARFCKKEGA